MLPCHHGNGTCNNGAVLGSVARICCVYGSHPAFSSCYRLTLVSSQTLVCLQAPSAHGDFHAIQRWCSAPPSSRHRGVRPNHNTSYTSLSCCTLKHVSPIMWFRTRTWTEDLPYRLASVGESFVFVVAAVLTSQLYQSFERLYSSLSEQVLCFVKVALSLLRFFVPRISHSLCHIYLSSYCASQLL